MKNNCYKITVEYVNGDIHDYTWNGSKESAINDTYLHYGQRTKIKRVISAESKTICWECFAVVENVEAVPHGNGCIVCCSECETMLNNIENGE